MFNNNLILTWPVISEACVEHRYNLQFVKITYLFGSAKTNSVKGQHAIQIGHKAKILAIILGPIQTD